MPMYQHDTGACWRTLLAGKHYLPVTLIARILPNNFTKRTAGSKIWINRDRPIFAAVFEIFAPIARMTAIWTRCGLSAVAKLVREALVGRCGENCHEADRRTMKCGGVIASTGSVNHDADAEAVSLKSQASALSFHNLPRKRSGGRGGRRALTGESQCGTRRALSRARVNSQSPERPSPRFRPEISLSRRDLLDDDYRDYGNNRSASKRV